MRPHGRTVICPLLCVVFSCSSASALHSGLADASGKTVFSKEFLHDYKAANAVASTGESVKPLLALLTRYSKPEEQAELELMIGIVYSQRTGLVDPAKAVTHLTNALKYRLPEQKRLQVLVWRGNSLEQLKRHEAALRDYLRTLLGCSYHDLSGGWPEIRSSNVTIYTRSDDPENAERARDYREYRKRIRLQRDLLWMKYSMVEAVRRVQARSAVAEERVMEMLRELSPDVSRHHIVSDSSSTPFCVPGL